MEVSGLPDFCGDELEVERKRAIGENAGSPLYS